MLLALMQSPEKQEADSTMVCLRPTRHERDETDDSFSGRGLSSSVLSLGAPATGKTEVDMHSQERLRDKVHELTQPMRSKIERQKSTLGDACL